MVTEKKNVLSLFSGCGGMDLGFEGGFKVLSKSIDLIKNQHWVEMVNNNMVLLKKTSFKTVFANDILKHAQSAWVPFFEGRGHSRNIFRTESIVDLVKKHQQGDNVFPKRVDVVTGGFPCQDFSLAGKRLGFNSHKDHQGKKNEKKNHDASEGRGTLYTWMKEVVAITKPKVFVAENVKGLVSLGRAKEIIEDDFRHVDQGYLVAPARVLNVKNFGVPQNRERVIFIGLSMRHLKKSAIKKFDANIYPDMTHGDGLLPYVSLKDVFRDLKEPENESKDADQQSYSKAKYYGKVQGNTEVNLNGVAPTIRSEHHGNIEFRRLSRDNGGKSEDELRRMLPQRRLTIRECSRIQTFPDDYQFIRKKTKTEDFSLSASGAYKVIGNAVPPLMAYHLAMNLENHWNTLFKQKS